MINYVLYKTNKLSWVKKSVRKRAHIDIDYQWNIIVDFKYDAEIDLNIANLRVEFGKKNSIFTINRLI